VLHFVAYLCSATVAFAKVISDRVESLEPLGELLER
jgi:hypothetical protein